MKIKKELIKREIAGESFLVPLGKTVYDANGLFILSELGSFLWDRLSDAQSADDLLRDVLAEYDVDEATAKTHVSAFVGKLKEHDFFD